MLVTTIKSLAPGLKTHSQLEFSYICSFVRSCLILFTLMAIVACGGSGDSSSNSSGDALKDDGIIDIENPVIDSVPLNVVGSIPLISNSDWNETAVRKVLQVFAFGGFASDKQITAWANQSPKAAIVQIISFNTTNQYLSPAENKDKLDSVDGSLLGLSKLWSSSSAQNLYAPDLRDRFEKDDWNSPKDVWLSAVNKRGLNPVRQRIGLLETNYHMVANLDASVNNRQMYEHYDSIMANLAADVPYQTVLADAAASAAIATQYNHKENKFIDAKFEGNEDFGREFHQLFFNILGTDDSTYHEVTTVKNTAKALTDMRVEKITEGDKTFSSEKVTMGTEYHFPSHLEILKQNINGSNAKEKLNALAEHAIKHPESVDNLPVKIVRLLADDTLTDANTKIIKQIWAELPEKNLLQFLRTYAISTAFHSDSRTKFWSSIERNVLFTNLVTLNNNEAYLNYYSPSNALNSEGITLFRPVHNVFGHQTGLEAASEPNVFKETITALSTGTGFIHVM